MNWIIALALVCAFFWFALGYHVVWPPTDDQIYGCPVQQQDGECR